MINYSKPVLFNATKTVVLKTNNVCNLKCSYCYEEFNQIKRKPSMSIETIKGIFHSLSEYCENEAISNLNIIWHGGEPMLMNLDFYKEVINLQKSIPNLQFKNLMQTNATLINDNWADFFVKNNFQIGISFDGSPVANTIHRQKTEEVINNVMLLNRHGINPSIICVISDMNYSFVDELFDFLGAINIHYLDLVPCYENNGKYSLSIDHYKEFYIRAFDKWWANNRPFDIRLFSNVVDILRGNIVSGQYITCSMTGRCGEIISIGPEGDVYFCDCLPKNSRAVIGNIIHQNVYSLTASENYRFLHDTNKTIHQDCINCSFKLLCGGGCLTRRISTSHLEYGKDYYCSARKVLFSHIQDIVGNTGCHSNLNVIPAFTRGPQPKYVANGR